MVGEVDIRMLPSLVRTLSVDDRVLLLLLLLS